MEDKNNEKEDMENDNKNKKIIQLKAKEAKNKNHKQNKKNSIKEKKVQERSEEGNSEEFENNKKGEVKKIQSAKIKVKINKNEVENKVAKSKFNTKETPKKVQKSQNNNGLLTLSNKRRSANPEQGSKFNNIKILNEKGKNNKKIPKNISMDDINSQQYNAKQKKFNEKDFNKVLEGFKDWENKKKEKIKKKQLEKNNKEQKNYNKQNIHHNKHLSMDEKTKVIERLYNEDIKRRKEKQLTILKIYELPFKPQVSYPNTFFCHNGFLSSQARRRNLYNNNIANTKNNKNMTINNKNNNNKIKYNSINENEEEEGDAEENYLRNNDNDVIFDDEVVINKLRARLFSKKKDDNVKSAYSVKVKQRLKFKEQK